MLRIIDIDSGSIAQELDIRPGDYVVSINDQVINDRLDYRFHISDENVQLRIRRGEEEIIYDIEKEAQDDLGLVLDEMKMKACGNKCVFCFVYQNPKGMRKAVYFKDEDYRFSFLYGHYVTLTTLKQSDLDRIVNQRLSPLYISVHATEEKTRKLLLGINREDYLLDKIRFLTEGGIELHAQIVLCPGINDGAVFDQTVADLKQFYPGVKSIAIVPVGLTRHRKNLFPLRIHTRPELQQMITYVDEKRKTLLRELGVHFIYLADEFFIKAGVELPGADYYDEFYQIENGVGEFRDMIDGFQASARRLPEKWPQETRITWVTGTLARGNLEKYVITPLNAIDNLHIDLVAVTNHFYGPTIQISGLLVGGDIYNQLKDRELGDLVLLPPRVLNNDGLFLDDWTVADLEQKLGVPCHVYTEPLSRLFSVIKKKRRKLVSRESA